MQIEPPDLDLLPCPICGRGTHSLKQMRIISTVAVFMSFGVSWTAIYRSCPQCMRAYIWKRCLINGFLTMILGYLVLVPYSLALTLVTLIKGHSRAVLLGITPEMEVGLQGVLVPTKRDKLLAIASVLMCFVPVVGLAFCWWVVSETKWCIRGWVREATEFAGYLSYFVTIIGIGLTAKLMGWF